MDTSWGLQGEMLLFLELFSVT